VRRKSSCALAKRSTWSSSTTVPSAGAIVVGAAGSSIQ
jgi:hypothetical protein